MKKAMVCLLIAITATGTVAADSAGFQLSLVPDVAIQDRDTEINGVSIGVWNENPSPNFNWQFGFVNGATGDSVGVQWFIFLPTFFNYAENYTGVQLSWVNYTSGSFVGFQGGAINIAGPFKGFQWGAVNVCQDLSGLQLGIVNFAQRSTSGVQIGLANIIPGNKWFSDGDLAQGMIFVNWGF
jgi:hypothetical protein